MVHEITLVGYRTLKNDLLVMAMMYCRHVPLWETIEVARYLANLFLCDVDSLPTDLLVHSYWTLMPRQFATTGDYGKCLRSRARRYFTRTCHNVNPFYCGRRFGEQTAVDRLIACRKLLYDGSDTPANYTVPVRVRTKIAGYRACLARSRSAVTLNSPFSVLQLRINGAQS